MTAPRRYDIAYGIIEDPVLALAPENRGLPERRHGLSLRLALLTDASPALRLNSRGWMALTPDVVSRLSGTEAWLWHCRGRLENRVSVFGRPIRAFLAAYLDFAERSVEAHRGSLPGADDDADGLFGHRDWVFSAFLPLPNAYLDLTGTDDRPATREDFFRFDIAFWTGRELLAVLLEGRSMRTPGRRRLLETVRAERDDIRIIELPAPLPGDEDYVFPSEAFPPDFAMFWEGLAVPFGPYRADAFDWSP